MQYRKDYLIGKFGAQLGLFFTHYSNGKFKSPNSGINSYGIYLGANYNIESENRSPVVKVLASKKSFAEPIKFNAVFRSGFSDGVLVGQNPKPFYHFGAYLDKRLGRLSGINVGVDYFITQSIKDYIEFYDIAFEGEDPTFDSNVDYKRAAVVIGHEFYITRFSLDTQVGYYFYKPFDYELDLYTRTGVKYYLTNTIFAGLGLKVHGAKAEAIESPRPVPP